MLGAPMVLLAKLVLGLVSAFAAIVATRSSAWEAPSPRRFDQHVIGAAVASRLAVFVGAFVVLGLEVPSDVPAYYYPQATHALAGELVYRDFPSSYAPLFPYLEAVAVAAWRSPRSLVLLAIVLEALSLPLWMRAARAAFDEPTARRALLLYVTSAPPLVSVALQGMNQIYCALLLSASFALLAAGRPLLSGLVGGSAAAVVKFLALLTLAGPFVGSDRRGRWLAGAVSVPLVVSVAFVLAGADVFMPVRIEAEQTSSGNLPFLLTALGATVPTGAWGIASIAALALALAAVVSRSLRAVHAPSVRSAFFVSALVLLTFLLLSKKAYTSYLCLAYFPLCAVVASRASERDVVAFGLFGAAAVLEPSLWFRWLDRGDLRALWAPGGPRGQVLAFFACELLLLAGYAWLWWRAASVLRTDDREGGEGPRAGGRAATAKRAG